VTTALVLSAGGMFAAWEVGVWKALAAHFQPDLVVGASAGAWNGWAIAGGIAPEELIENWLHPSVSAIRILHGEPLRQKACELWSRFQPQLPFGLTVVEAPNFRTRLIREREITWRHLAATCSIPALFPPVAIEGRFYVDGGLKGALPLWAAEEMGATRLIAVNCLNGLPFRVMRRLLPPRPCSPELPVISITPSERLGSLHDALYWSRPNIERWVSLGERDGTRALSSVC